MNSHATRSRAKRPARATPRRGALRPPFHADYLPYLVAHASHLILVDFHARLKRYGLPVADWRVLATLAGGRPYTVGALARAALAKQPTVSRVVDRLVQRGWVRRVAAVQDGRQALVELTGKGRARVMPAVAAARRHERSLLARYPERDVVTLKRMLRRFIQGFEGSTW